MQLKQLLKIIDNCLPAETAMEGDKIGLQIQSGQVEINKILITLELNEEVINEAIKLNTNCIITYHPLIFFPIVTINESDRVGILCNLLMRNSIALVAIHTNFDSYLEGNSYLLSEKLGLKRLNFLVRDKKYSDKGMGTISETTDYINQEELLAKVQNVCNSPLRYCLNKKNKKIKKIAIVGGSGSSFLQQVIDANCDAFITADVSYHIFHKANGNIMLIDPGHYEMEQFVPQGLASLLKNLTLNDNIEIITSKELTNPVRYFPDDENYFNMQKTWVNNPLNK